MPTPIPTPTPEIFRVVRDCDNKTLEKCESMLDAMIHMQNLAQHGVVAHVVCPDEGEG